MQCPAVLVSAPASGQGKTLVTAALASAWRQQGLRVQAFKCGPDFIDSQILQAATLRPVYNVDLGMCGLADGQTQLYRAAQEADVILLEGVMGLYDGSPSTADIAKAFDIPVALVIDASGMAQTFAAVARGLSDFDSSIQVAGVIANKVGSLGHAKLLSDALPEDITMLGAMTRDEQFALPERHLGLHLANEIDDLSARIMAAAKALTNDDALDLPAHVHFRAPSDAVLQPLLKGKTIAIARDEAFCFIYPANVDCLQAMGANVVEFSLLADDTLPAADAYWIPGGYPELHLSRIQQNTRMHQSLLDAFKQGLPMLAECGGMLALGETLNDTPVFGLLSGHGKINSKLQGLGTQHLDLEGTTIGAHTFHYGEFETLMTPTWTAKAKFGTGEVVYQYQSITASFLHFYFPSNPMLTAQFFTS